MLHKFARRAAVLFAIAGAAGCTVHQAETPSPTGPSTLAHSVTMTAIPDHITQDGSSQSSVVATAIGPDGRPQAGVIFRMDMIVAGVLVDYGTLSGRSIVTGVDGKASTIYTAPNAPPPPTSSVPATVSVRATPIGSDAQTSISTSVDIRLMPAGIILPPAGTPTAVFTVTPTPVTVAVPVNFDASASTVGTGASQIVTYAWNFGDGTSGSGRTVQHTFGTAAQFNVTLTVTNDRGLSASASLFIPVAAPPTSTGTLPSAQFTFSPTSPGVNQQIFFNASTSTSPGHTVTGYAWDFGDGSSGTGVTPTHTYATAGTFTATLIVTDDVGQKGVTAKTVTIAPAAGGTSAVLAANFSFSPTAPGVNETVNFNGTTSTAGTGHTIATYRWIFGDGTTGSGVTTTHAYTAAGAYTIQLTVIDEVGTSATSTGQVITVGSPPSPTANFTFSPTTPGKNDQVVFDASTSSTAQGQTITDVAWNFGDGTAVIHCPGGPVADCPGPTNRVSAHFFSFSGVFTVNLVVTDSAGRTGSHATNLTIVEALPVVAITISPSPATTGATVQYSANNSTYFSNSGPASYSWTFGDGFTCSTASPANCLAGGGGVAGNASNPTHRYLLTGTVSVGLTITDTKNRSGVASKDLIVNSGNPTAVLSVTKGGGNNVTGDGNASTAVGGATIATYTFNWGDPSAPDSGASASVPHTYALAGTYTVRLTVTDNNVPPRSGTTTVTVTVP